MEFTFFQANGGTRLLSQEIVVGTESEKPKHVSSGSLPVVTEDVFLASADENGSEIKTEKKLTAWQEFCRKKRLDGLDFSEIAKLWKDQKGRK